MDGHSRGTERKRSMLRRSGMRVAVGPEGLQCCGGGKNEQSRQVGRDKTGKGKVKTGMNENMSAGKDREWRGGLGGCRTL